MRDLREVVINTIREDYHTHSSNFSDGENTIDEMIAQARNLGMRRIAITDHSQAALNTDGIYFEKESRANVFKWHNRYDGIEVMFGTEGDLLDETGRICTDIRGVSTEFLILSYHKDVYSKYGGDVSKSAQGFAEAIRKHHGRINIIGHPSLFMTKSETGIIIEEANAHSIPLEVDAKYFLIDPSKWTLILDNARKIYINSDAHSIDELMYRQKAARSLIKGMGYKI